MLPMLYGLVHELAFVLAPESRPLQSDAVPCDACHQRMATSRGQCPDCLNRQSLPFEE